MLEYVSEIRVTIESLLTLGSLWWTIRTLVVMAALKDQLTREERTTQDQVHFLQLSIKKIRDSSRKVRDKIIPGQVHIVNQLNHQMIKMLKDIEKTNVPKKIKLYEEVKEFYTEQPDSRYFRSSEYVPGEETER
ncbi:MAG: hypothetical protein V3U53_06870 [bacterium]